MRGSVYTMGDRLGLNNFALANVANSFVDRSVSVILLN